MSADKKSAKDSAVEWIKSIVIALAIAFFIKTFLFNSTLVKGSSMQPTLHENDRIFVNKIIYRINEPERGDIITLHAPDRENTEYIKRVIGVPGDEVEITDGKVIVNGKVLEEPYTAPGAYTNTYDKNKWKVPEGKIFVLGDNREPGASKDSRSLGLIEESSVVGRAGLRYYPFSRIEELAD